MTKVDELEGHVAALATEVSELKDSIDALTVALERAVRVAVARG
jgi:hypothetical protein